MSVSEVKPLSYIDEPELMFGHGQVLQSPKDGLLLFGPLADSRGPAELRVGVVGRPQGIDRYRRWVEKIKRYIPAHRSDAAHHLAFPGFEAVFGCKWPPEPVCSLPVTDDALAETLYLEDKHEAIYKTVGLYVKEIERYLREEEAHVDLWFVVIPEEVYTYGRPTANVPKDLRQESELKMDLKRARALQQQPSLFAAENEAAELYKYEVHFHNQLKARLLDSKAVVQVVRETSLAPTDFERADGQPLRRLQDAATLAWNITTTAYFKASGRPWKLANVRDGVCYVGLVFKRDMTSLSAGNACCAAQMFLDSGDGLIFRGAVGPWYSESTKEFHLKRKKAMELMEMILTSYRRQHGSPPLELFIHGKTRFNDEEWEGFTQAVPQDTKLVGVRIRDDKGVKLFSLGNEPVLRGTVLPLSKRRGYLWTRGYVPRLQTYAGREVPNPLFIEVCRGDANLTQVMADIMGLTKVNFNRCEYADGYPVTLRFSNHVGEILTATPETEDEPPLPFKHYI